MPDTANRPSMTLTQDQRMQMILAPQLRQSLELLQLPILELRQLLQKELLQNPTIEERPLDAQQIEVEAQESAAGPDGQKELNFKEDFEALSKMDGEWGDYFRLEQEPYDSAAEKRRAFFFDSLVQQPSMQEHLLHQLDAAGISGADRELGELLIGNINEDGYLKPGIEDLASSASADGARLKDVLDVIQDFDPVGVGARDLRECLLIQLERLGEGDSTAAAVVRDHLEALGHKKFSDVARALNVPVEEVHVAAKLIGTLEPRPGRRFSSGSVAYVVAEVVVQNVAGEYVVILNEDHLPRLRISKDYRNMLRNDESGSDVKDYIRERIRSGVFLMKSIVQRQRTLFRVATEIVRVQRDFLDHGVSHLKPLVMAAVADALGIHETTVCRCIANKYMQTPQGMFEMKYFFTPGIRTADGRNISNKTVRDMLGAMVAGEDPEHPLSDQELADELKKQGVEIARRTVAKYRVALKIAPSHLRKAF